MEVKFVLLAGSRARGDWNDRSDVDVVVLGDVPHEDLSSIPASYPGYLNLIEFTSEDFWRIYTSGSLFLQHCFGEGKLLAGDAQVWARLRSGFRVQRSFKAEIRHCYEVCGLLRELHVFGGRFRSPLVSAHTQVKNAAIFYLASTGQYCFNKEAAVRNAAIALGISDWAALCSLRAFYDYSERSLDVQLPFAVGSSEMAAPLLRKSIEFVRRAYGASG